jgi:hypothetical protein
MAIDHELAEDGADQGNRCAASYSLGGNVTRAESAIGADLAARRPSNPITLCDGHGSDFVTVTGQILMAVHTAPLS